jgi:hypothetical protein
VRGAYAEGRACLTDLLARPAAAEYPVAQAHALAAAGHFATCQGNYADSDQYLANAHALAVELGQRLLLGVITHFQAQLARWRGNLPGARARFEFALATYRQEGHRAWEASALAHQAFTLHEMGDLDLAEVYAKQSLLLCEATGNTWDASRASRVLGRIAAQRGDDARAEAEAGVGLDRHLDDEYQAVQSMLTHGLHSTADPSAAWRLYRQSLELAERSRNPLLTARSLAGLATLAVTRAPEQAVRLAAAANTLRAKVGVSSSPLESRRLKAAMETALHELGSEAFAAAWDTGRQSNTAKLLADTPPDLV